MPVVRYEDSDLDAYNEMAIAFYVRGPLGQGVYVHQMPVTQEFTLHAGRQLWGYPKFLAGISIDERPDEMRARVEHEGEHVLTLTIKRARLRTPARTVPTYTFLDGALRFTRWEQPGARPDGRFGGATVELGEHPIAEELRALGLPRRALGTQAVRNMRARFGPARAVSSVTSL